MSKKYVVNEGAHFHLRRMICKGLSLRSQERAYAYTSKLLLKLPLFIIRASARSQSCLTVW